MKDDDMDFTNWVGVPRPERVTLEGRYARLEPIDPERHGAALFASARRPAATIVSAICSRSHPPT